MKIAIAQINPTIGALAANLEKILATILESKRQGAELVLFPEMALCGYPPEDLLLLPSFIQAMENKLFEIVAASQGIAVVVGLVRKNPLRGEKGLFNTAALIENGELIGFQDKILLPDYDVFSERRYFEPGAETIIWNLCGKRIGVTICEDIWQHAEAVEYTSYAQDPIEALAHSSPDLILSLSASPFYMERHKTRLHVCQKAAQAVKCPLLFCNQVGANDRLIFDGYSLYVNASGGLALHAKGFEEDLLFVDLDKDYPTQRLPEQPIEDLYKALVLGVRDYFHKQGFTKACLGLSGGIDSAVVAALAAEALGKENILALSLPSRFTPKKSQDESAEVAARLGIRFQEISIEKPFTTFLETLEPHFEGKPADVTEENLQARIRGVILMAFANKFGYLLLTTGNKSEMAMGYMTLYGDMCGGLSVLSDVSKGQVYALARWINSRGEAIPASIFEKAPSAELREGQKDSDSLPEYPIVDLVLGAYVELHLSPEEIAKAHHIPLPLVKELVRKIHQSEYKRQQAPPGLRVTRRSFTVGRRFPIVQNWNT